MRTLTFIAQFSGQVVLGGIFWLLYALMGAVDTLRRLGGRLCCRRKTSAAAVEAPGCILITGAASGLGKEFALQYAAKPSTRVLALTDRSEAGLAETAAEVAQIAGSRVRVLRAVLDVTDEANMTSWINSVDDAEPLDLVLANAGTSEAILGLYRDLDAGTRRVVAINIMGVVNTVMPALARMRARGKGQVGVLSSLSSLLGFWAGTPTYAASKAFVRFWGMGLRAHLWNEGVRVNVIVPGWVDTALVRGSIGALRQDPQLAPILRDDRTARRLTPFLIGPVEAVRAFIGGLARDEAVIVYPTISYLIVGFMHNMPFFLYDLLISVSVGMENWAIKRAAKKAAAAAGAAGAAAADGGAAAMPGRPKAA